MHERSKTRVMCIRAFVHLCIVVFTVSATAQAADKYALVVTGASAGAPYAEKYDQWRTAFVKALRERFDYPRDHIVVLAEKEEPGVAAATRENVQRALGDLRTRLTKDDVLIVLLVGHGSAAGDEDAKFNLVGPDLSAKDWADLVRPIAGRLVFVDSTGGSYPFLHALAGRNRVVLTATDSAAQQFETVFPEYFVKAFDDPAADADKNGRVSLWEAFSYASAEVGEWYDQHGQLPTERALLDDTGAGIGREARNPGTDGAVAKVTYFDRASAPAAVDGSAMAALMKRRAELEAALDDLKARKPQMTPEDYEAALEKILVELARVSQQIRSGS